MDNLHDLEFDQKEAARDHFIKSGRYRNLQKTHAQMVNSYGDKSPDLERLREWCAEGRWVILARGVDGVEDQKVPEKLPENHPFHINNRKGESLDASYDPVNTDNPTKESQLLKCRRAMQKAYRGNDMKMYYNLLKLECELGGLLIRKESIIVNNIDSMTKDELSDARTEIERKLKQLDDTERKTIDHNASDFNEPGNGETEAS